MAQTTVTDREVRFRDGLGVRVPGADHTGDTVEQLRVSADLAIQESGIRERVGRLVNFRHVKYVRLRGVDRLKNGLKELVITYDAIEGDRLSTILETAATAPLTVDVDVALQIVRDLLPGIGILHDSRKVTHGAIAPERLIYTQQHRLIIVDHGFGLALSRLNHPRKKLWEQFRIAVPSTAKSVFDERTDVVQIGLVALSVLLGRPLADDDYPGHLKRLVLSVKEHSSKRALRPLTPELRQWLERALPIDEEHPFKTVREAQDAFETLVTKGRYAPTAAAVKAFLMRYREHANAAAEVPSTSVSLDRALEELTITIGPAVPVARSRATPSVEPAPVAEPMMLDLSSMLPQLEAEALVAPQPADDREAPASRTLVVASAIEGHGTQNAAGARSDGTAESTDLPRSRTGRKGERLSEAPSGRERVGDAARRARHSSLRSDPAKPAAPPMASADAKVPDAAPRTRGRLDALRALEEELTRLAALDLVMPQRAAEAPAAEPEAPPAIELSTHLLAGAATDVLGEEPRPTAESTGIAAVELSPPEISEDVTPLTSETPPTSQLRIAIASEPVPVQHPSALAIDSAVEKAVVLAAVVAEPAAIEIVAAEISAADVAMLDTPALEVALPADAAASAKRPFRSNAIDDELARLMGERDLEECATPVWTIDGSDSPSAVGAREEDATLPAVTQTLEAAEEGTLADAAIGIVAASEPMAPAFVAYDDRANPSQSHDEVIAAAAVIPSASTDTTTEGELTAIEQASAWVFEPADEVIFAAADDQTYPVQPWDATSPVVALIEAANEPSPSIEPEEPVFQLTPPSADMSVLLGSFELTPPAPADLTPVERPRLLELSTFEQMAADAYEAAEVQLSTRYSSGFLFEPEAEVVPVSDTALPVEETLVVSTERVAAEPPIEIESALLALSAGPTEEIHVPSDAAEAVALPVVSAPIELARETEPVEAFEPLPIGLETAEVVAETPEPVEAAVPLSIGIGPDEGFAERARRVSGFVPELDALELALGLGPNPEPAEMPAVGPTPGLELVELVLPDPAPLEAELIAPVAHDLAGEIMAPAETALFVESAPEDKRPMLVEPLLTAPMLVEPVLLVVPTIELFVDPMAEPLAELVVEAIAEPVVEPIAELVVEAIAEPVVELIAELVSEPLLLVEPVPLEEPVLALERVPTVDAVLDLDAVVVSESVAQEAKPLDIMLPLDVAFETFEQEAPVAAACEAAPVDLMEQAAQVDARHESAAEPVPVVTTEPIQVAEADTTPIDRTSIVDAPVALSVLPVEPPAAVIVVQVAASVQTETPVARQDVPVVHKPSKSSRKRARRRNKRHHEPLVVPQAQRPAEIAIVPAPPQAISRADVTAPAAVDLPAPLPEAPAVADTIALAPAAEAPQSLDPVSFFEWDASQASDAIPAWARGAANAEPGQTGDGGGPQGIGTVQFQEESLIDHGAFGAPAQSTQGPAWQQRSEQVFPPAHVVPFHQRADREMQPGYRPSGVAREHAVASPASLSPARRQTRFRIDWGRTLAASLVVALLEGVAFAAAWWYITPNDVGWLVVHTKPTGLELAVDGMYQGRTPFATSLTPGRHTIELRQGTATRVIPVEISGGVQTEQRVTWGAAFKTGQARITSSPEGARVSIDGKVHGTTPVLVSELAAGKHSVRVESSSGTVTAALVIEPGETTELEVPVYSGWVSVLAPVQLEIFDRDRLIGTTEAEKLMLSPGPHKLTLVNESLGYRGTQNVDVRPGATTSVSVLPKTDITVEGPRGVEVLIDGEHVGELPIGKLKAVIGTREFLFRSAEQGERRQIVLVTMTAPVVVRY